MSNPPKSKGPKSMPSYQEGYRSGEAAGRLVGRHSEQALHKVIDAWEALPGGQLYGPREIEHWMKESLHPAIENARRVLGRRKPGTDGN
jgi:hypothetical protein